MEIIKECPNCKDPVIIESINCGIFRHGIYINTGKQMNPHASKDECDAAIKEGIYGCGLPFKYQNGELVCCDYI